jgi:hypothetical protein
MEAWKGDEQEMFRLQDRTALIPDVRNITLTLIEREDDTRSWDNFSGLFLTLCHANLRGWGYIFITDQASQAYAEMLV